MFKKINKTIKIILMSIMLVVFFSVSVFAVGIVAENTVLVGGLAINTQCSISLSNGNTLLAGGYGNWAIVSQTGATVAQGAWVRASNYSHILTATQLTNGNILLAGTYGDWQIITQSGAYITNGTWSGGASSSNNIRTSVLLDNGNIMMLGDNTHWQIITPTGANVNYGTVIPSSSVNIYKATKLSNGNVFLGGTFGKWAITAQTGAVLNSGTWIHNTPCINALSEFSNGNILLGGQNGNWQIITASGENVASGTAYPGFYIYASILLPNDNVLIAGNAKRWEIIDKNGNIISSGDWGYKFYSNSITGVCVLKNGNILMAGADGVVRIFSPTIMDLVGKNYISSYGATSISEFSNGDILYANANGNWKVISNNDEVVRQQTWLYGSKCIYTSNILSNGNIFLAGRDGLYEIVNQLGGTAATNYWSNGTYDIYTSCLLPNNNIFLGGESGRWQIMSPTGEYVSKGIWAHGASYQIFSATTLNNGNIFICGNGGKWQILTPNGDSVLSGTWIHGAVVITKSILLSNGNILLTVSDGRWQIITATGQNVNYGYPIRSNITFSATELTNGDILMLGDNSLDVLNSSGTLKKSLKNAAFDPYASYLTADNRISITTTSGYMYTLNNIKPILSIQNKTNTSISLSINNNGKFSNVEYYIVRATDSNFTQNVSVIKNWTSGTTLVDTGLEAGERYYYYCIARSLEGIETPVSDTVTSSTLAYTPGVSFGSPTVTSSPLTISANSNCSNVQYYLQRAMNSSFTLNVVTMSNWQTTTSFSNIGLIPGIKYYYRVKARNMDNVETSFSTTASKSTLPSAVANLTENTAVKTWHATEGRIRVYLDWDKPTGATGYIVGVHDGYTWRETTIPNGDITAWDSSIEKIYPAEATINGYLTNARTTDIFNKVKGGLELRDDPRNLYRSGQLPTYNEIQYYMFYVKAYGENGSSLPSAASYINSTVMSAKEGAPVVNSIAPVNGATRITEQLINLNISATASGSGLKSIKISNNADMSGATIFTWPTQGQTVGEINLVYDVGLSPGGVTLYAKAVNVNNVESDEAKKLNLFFINDITPPTIRPTLNSGDEFSTSNNLELSLDASDDFTNLNDLLFKYSFDGTTWNPSNTWLPFTFVKDITAPVSVDDSLKTVRVFVQIKDDAGNIGNGNDSIKVISESGLLNSKLNLMQKSDIVQPKITYFGLPNKMASATSRSGGNISVVCMVEDNATLPEDIEVYYSTDDGDTWAKKSPGKVLLSIGTGAKTIHVKAVDAAGNYTLKELFVFVL